MNLTYYVLLLYIRTFAYFSPRLFYLFLSKLISVKVTILSRVATI